MDKHIEELLFRSAELRQKSAVLVRYARDLASHRDHLLKRSGELQSRSEAAEEYLYIALGSARRRARASQS